MYCQFICLPTTKSLRSASLLSLFLYWSKQGWGSGKYFSLENGSTKFEKQFCSSGLYDNMAHVRNLMPVGNEPLEAGMFNVVLRYL
jgi:hypothetical protein